MAHVMVPTQTFETRVVSRNTIAAMYPAMSSGISAGNPTSAPGVSSSAWPGGYFDATAGTTSTCGCSKNAGIGGLGAVHWPRAKILAWSTYETSSCTLAIGTRSPHTYHTTAAETSAITGAPNRCSQRSRRSTGTRRATAGNRGASNAPASTSVDRMMASIQDGLGIERDGGLSAITRSELPNGTDSEPRTICSARDAT